MTDCLDWFNDWLIKRFITDLFAAIGWMTDWLTSLQKVTDWLTIFDYWVTDSNPECDSWLTALYNWFWLKDWQAQELMTDWHTDCFAGFDDSLITSLDNLWFGWPSLIRLTFLRHRRAGWVVRLTNLADWLIFYWLVYISLSEQQEVTWIDHKVLPYVISEMSRKIFHIKQFYYSNSIICEL
jgi:hypothetical protein